MILLGIETATTVCGVAVVREGQIVAEKALEVPQAHAEKLLTLIRTVLGSVPVTATELDAIAVSAGPGSFTGLRIGLSTAKGLAYSTGCRVVAVPTLRALTEHARKEAVATGAGYLLAALDARRDEVYAFLARLTDGRMEEVWGERALSVKDLAGVIPGGPVLVAGDGAGKLAAAARASGLSLLQASPGSLRCDAGSVALLGERMLQDGMTTDVGSMEPLYIKEFFTTAQPLF